MKVKEEFELPLNFTADSQLKDLHNLIGMGIKLPEISLSTETWITLIEQFLMLILIIGRWMLPKGDLTRDQLSQLLLVYIGTAADIIEFFDSFKDDKIASEPILVLLTLAIWSWSLMQFTVVLTATKSRKSRLTSTKSTINKSESCCTIDVWGIALNITLQDAPFLVFRLLLITHFQIISYMNVFFTCKNTLVILLQIYRLYVVRAEHSKKKNDDDEKLTSIAVISKGDFYENVRNKGSNNNNKRKYYKARKVASEDAAQENDENKGKKKIKSLRKDTGYSTGSSHTSTKKYARKTPRKIKRTRENVENEDYEEEEEILRKHTKQKMLKRETDRETRGRKKLEEEVLSEEMSDDEEIIIKPLKIKDKIIKEKSRISSTEKQKYDRKVSVPMIISSSSEASSEE